MPEVDPNNSYGTPEGPEMPATENVTEPLAEPTGGENPESDHERRENA